MCHQDQEIQTCISRPLIWEAWMYNLRFLNKLNTSKIIHDELLFCVQIYICSYVYTVLKHTVYTVCVNVLCFLWELVHTNYMNKCMINSTHNSSFCVVFSFWITKRYILVYGMDECLHNLYQLIQNNSKHQDLCTDNTI